jgi:hypothetical protein
LTVILLISMGPRRAERSAPQVIGNQAGVLESGAAASSPSP